MAAVSFGCRMTKMDDRIGAFGQHHILFAHRRDGNVGKHRVIRELHGVVFVGIHYRTNSNSGPHQMMGAAIAIV